MILFQRGATSWGFQVWRWYCYWPYLRFWRVGVRPIFGYEYTEAWHEAHNRQRPQ